MYAVPGLEIVKYSLVIVLVTNNTRTLQSFTQNNYKYDCLSLVCILDFVIHRLITSVKKVAEVLDAQDYTVNLA